MRITVIISVILSLFIVSGCTQEKKYKDRSEADEMFNRICKLTIDYTEKLTDSPDSAEWAKSCKEFEEKLDKISFSYPPDTDLLLTEGQNDTIHSLMLEYVKARDERIHAILNPIVELDSLIDSDSMISESVEDISQADASRSLGN